VSWSWDDWRGRSLRVTAGLRELGVRPGERVACLLTNTPDVCASVLGVWLAGGCLLSLPLPGRGMDPSIYVAQLRRIVIQSEPVVLMCDGALARALEHTDVGVRTIAVPRLPAGRPAEPTLPADDDPIFVQYSSGSTTEPKGCVLAARAIAGQLARLEEALAVDAERDIGVFWLPLSHDMGLFGGLLFAYWAGHRTVIGTPQRFLTHPWSWFDDCSRFGATLSAAPNFALDVAARVGRAREPGPFPMRALVVGGERIEASVLRRVHETFGDERLPWASLLPAYGLAEAVLAVTTTPVDRGPRIVDVDAAALERGELVPARSGARATSAVSSGRALPGNEIEIPSSPVGEIVLRSSTLAEGYLDQPELTAERFTPAGLHTGDVGFELDGELFVRGRVDDLMFVAGRNVYARDVELALTRVSGLRAGGCAVVDVEGDGGTRLVALAELHGGHPDFAVMAEGIVASARAAAGVRIDECVFLPHGRLPKTPSGKLQRFRCREMIADGSRADHVRIES
jgi:fatty-acyl-CoA synthase